MADDTHINDDGLPRDSLLEAVREVLAHLYDYTFLQDHPLIAMLGLDSLPVRERMGSMRALVLSAIEAMNPQGETSFRSLPARSYNVLNLHYVEGLTIQEVGKELALSERQVYRELRKAELDLATLLAARANQPAEDVATRAELVQIEADRMREEAGAVDVAELIERAADSVRRLAEQRGVPLELRIGALPEDVRAFRLAARQAIVTTLSLALQAAAPGSPVRLIAVGQGERVHVEISFVQEESGEAALPLPMAARHLIKRMEGEWRVTPATAGLQQVVVSLTLGQRLRLTLLVIDDNQELVELFRRYLEGEDCELIGAATGQEGLRLAEELAPDAIVLDVMMPHQDGWEVLQQLHNRPVTRELPVIVCSVLDDPELAFSLGAVGYLSKPVTRDQLLKVLAPLRSGIPPRSHSAAPPDSAAPRPT